MEFSPPGYSDWGKGDDPFAWRIFSSEFTTGKPSGTFRGRPLPVESLLKDPLPFDFMLCDIPVRFFGENILSDIFFSTPSRKEAKKLLKYFNYSLESGRGKGSHELWKGPDNRTFPLPRRDPLSGVVFKNLLHHFHLSKPNYLQEIRPKL